MNFADDFASDSEGSDAEAFKDTKPPPEGFLPSFVIFAIDTHPTMFVQTDGETAFNQAIMACYNIADSHVLTSNVKHQFAVVLADSKNHEVVQFSNTIPDAVKLLGKICAYDDLRGMYERTGAFDLAEFLLTCKKKLLDVNSSAYRRTIVYVTNDDDPAKGNAELLKIAQVTKSFPEFKIWLKVVTTNPKFKCALLYNNLSAEVNVVESVDEMSDTLSSYINPKIRSRTANFYPLRGNFERYIPVVLKNYLSPKTLSNNIHTTRDTFKEVKKIKTEPLPLSYSLACGGDGREPLTLSLLEKAQISETAVPIGYSLAFVNEPSSVRDLAIKPGLIMEAPATGDVDIFNALWKFCAERTRVLVCLRKHKAGGTVREVELIPKMVNRKCVFLERVLACSEDLDVMKLAFESAFEDEPIDEEVIDEHEEAVVEEFVKKLTIDSFNLKIFFDPATEKRRAYIKAQLLDQEVEEIRDYVNDESIDKHVGTEIEKLLEIFDGCQTSEKSSKKRSGSCLPSKSKKGKQEEDGEEEEKAAMPTLTKSEFL